MKTPCRKIFPGIIDHAVKACIPGKTGIRVASLLLVLLLSGSLTIQGLEPEGSLMPGGTETGLETTQGGASEDAPNPHENPGLSESIGDGPGQEEEAVPAAPEGAAEEENSEKEDPAPGQEESPVEEHPDQEKGTGETSPDPGQLGNTEEENPDTSRPESPDASTMATIAGGVLQNGGLFAPLASTITLDAGNLVHGSNGPGWSYSYLKLAFTAEANGRTYVLTGTAPQNVQIDIQAGVDESAVFILNNIYLEGKDVTLAEAYAISVAVGAKANLVLADDSDNRFDSRIKVPQNAAVTISGDTGKLNVVSQAHFGAAIGGAAGQSADAGHITINGGHVTAKAVGAGAAIGAGWGWGGTFQSITINGGTVIADQAVGTVNSYAAIGGGYGSGHGPSGDITITGGTIYATGGTNAGAAIGGGWGQSMGDIIITGGDIYAVAGVRGAGIGAGVAGDVNSIQISGDAKIIAMGGPSGGGSAIGDGEIKPSSGEVARVGYISIEDSVELYAYSRFAGYPAISARSLDNGGNANIENGVITNAVFEQNQTTEIPVKVIDYNTNALLRTLNLPQNCYGFAFSTGVGAEVSLLDIYSADNTRQVGAFVNTADETRDIHTRKGADAYKVVNVRFQNTPSLPNPTHKNVAKTTAELVSTGHHLNVGDFVEGRFDYALNQTLTNGPASVQWVDYEWPEVTKGLSGLASNTKYFYRSYLKSSIGETQTTIAASGPFFVTLPDITGFKLDSVNSGSATFSGSVAASANGNPLTGVVVEYNQTGDFTGGDADTKTLALSRTSQATPGVGQYTDTSFSAQLSGLTPGQIYYARAVVKNADGAETYGGADASGVLEFVPGPAISVYAWHDANRDGLDNNGEGHMQGQMRYTLQQYTGGAWQSVDVVTRLDGQTSILIPPGYGTFRVRYESLGDPDLVPTLSGGDSGIDAEGYTGSITLNALSPQAETKGGFAAKPLADVTLGKTVAGNYADLSREFTFTITLWDDRAAPLAGVSYNYTGGTLAGKGATAPADGTLVLDAEGQATFTLGHGQTITLRDLPGDGYIQVAETVAPGYTTTHTSNSGFAKGSGDNAPGDTGRQAITEDLAIQFTNTRNSVVPTGIAVGGEGASLLGPAALLAAGVALALSRRLRRRLKGGRT